MASITTSIQLTDHISAPLQNMAASLGMLVDGFYALDAQLASGFDVSYLYESVEAISEVEAVTRAIGESILANGMAQEVFNQTVFEGTKAVDSMRDSMESVATAYRLLGGGVSIPDNNAENVRSLTPQSMEFAPVQESLIVMPELDMRFIESLGNAEQFLGEINFNAQLESIANGLTSGVEKIEDVMAGERIATVVTSISDSGNAMETVEFASQMESMQNELAMGVEKIENVMADERISAVFTSISESVSSGIADTVLAMKSSGFAVALEEMVDLISSGMGDMLFAVQSTMQEVFSYFTGTIASGVLPVVSTLVSTFSLFTLAVDDTANALFLLNELLGVGQLLFDTQAISLATLVVAMHELAIANYDLSASMISSLSQTVLILSSMSALSLAIFYLIDCTIKWGEMTVSSVAMICEVIAAAATFVANLFLDMVQYIILLFVELWTFIGAFATFFGGVFHAPVQVVADLFLELFHYIVSVVSACAKAIDSVFGSNLSGAISGFHGLVKEFSTGIALSGEYTADIKVPNLDAFLVEPFVISPVFANGFDGVGMEVVDAFGGFSKHDTMQNSVENEMALEDFSYLRDLANGESNTQMQSTEIAVHLGGVTNNVSQNTDLDGFLSYLTEGVEAAMAKSVEGVHN